MGSTLRLVMAFGLIGCFWHGVCQPGFLDSPQQSPPDPTIYESFFRQVEQLKNMNISGPVLLNGQASKLTQPTAKDSIGLTDQELQVLNAIASDCEAKIRLFDIAARPFIFEVRLQLISSENSPQVIQQLKNLDNDRTQIVLAHIQEQRLMASDE